MNRAQRRAAAKRGASVAAGIAQMQAQSGGIYRLVLVSVEGGVALLVAALGGDVQAAELFRTAADCARQIGAAEAEHHPVLCLTCPTPLRTSAGALVCLVVPETNRATQALGSAVCPECAARPDVEARVHSALRKIWPDLKTIKIMPGPEAVQ